MLWNSSVEILSAKELLLLKSGLPDPFRKSLKDDENVLDIAKFFVNSAKENRDLPTLVIFEPAEVPACMEEINACITTRVNDMCRRFDGFMERINKGEFHVFTHTIPSHSAKAIILRRCKKKPFTLENTTRTKELY